MLILRAFLYQGSQSHRTWVRVGKLMLLGDLSLVTTTPCPRFAPLVVKATRGAAWSDDSRGLGKEAPWMLVRVLAAESDVRHRPGEQRRGDCFSVPCS